MTERATVFQPDVFDVQPAALTARLLKPGRAPAALLPAVTPARLHTADELLAGRLTLIGETYPLPERPDWRANPSRDKEWQIALHKHPFAVDLALAYSETGRVAYLQRWVSLTESWLAEMATGFVSASDAQVEAKRVEHWCLALVALAGTPATSELPAGLLPALLARIGDEVRYILDHLKPARNHRTFQLYSVFLAAALFPELRDSEGLLAASAALLSENLLTDLLPDGVQVERSTHYHQLVMETAARFLALARWHGLALGPELEGRIARGLEFSLWAQWPDGSLPLIGDSDDGDHRPLLALGAELTGAPALRWGATLGREGAPPAETSRHFADGGYFVLGDGWRDGPASYAARQHVLYDCGPLGEGSHCHYDLFSFTYFAGGGPLVIDPGRYTYDSAPDAAGVDWRHAFKATSAHNTVTIDGRDQTRYISKWRRDREGGTKRGPKHGPAPVISERSWRLGQISDWVDATARSAEYEPAHRRLLLYMRRQYLLLFDLVAIGDGREHHCDLRFHLAPGVRGQVSLSRGAECLVARAPGLEVWAAGGPGLAGRVAEGWASRSYGVKEPAPLLSFTQVGDRPIPFCSLVVPTSAVTIEHMAVSGGPAEEQLRCVVRGRSGGAAWADEVLVATGHAPVEAESPEVHFRGRHLALRRDDAGRIIYLCAHGAERLTWAGGASAIAEQEHVEWSL